MIVFMTTTMMVIIVMVTTVKLLIMIKTIRVILWRMDKVVFIQFIQRVKVKVKVQVLVFKGIERIEILKIIIQVIIIIATIFVAWAVMK